MHLMNVDSLSATLVVRFISVVLVTPFALFGGAVVASIGGFCGQLYIRTQLRVKRHMSNAKAPLLAQ